MSRSELQKEWEQRIAVFRASGQTQSCQENYISLHKLRYWLRKIENHTKSNTKSSPRWIPVTTVDSFPGTDESVLIKIGEASIEVKPGFNPSFLSDVVRMLKSSC